MLAEQLREFDRFPLTVSWTQGASRAKAQNRLCQKWFTEIAQHLGDQHREDVRAECKLVYGIPILSGENSEMAASYKRHLGSLFYSDQIDAIRDLQLPVTSLMSVKQMSDFMDRVQRQFSGMGVQLTDPKAQKYLEEFQ